MLQIGNGRRDIAARMCRILCQYWPQSNYSSFQRQKMPSHAGRPAWRKLHARAGNWEKMHMSRWMLAGLLGTGLIFSTAATPAEAHKKRYTYNQCEAKDLRNQSHEWKCKLSEKCCWDRLLRRGSCVASSDQCR